jgi:hypothetical protein
LADTLDFERYGREKDSAKARKINILAKLSLTLNCTMHDRLGHYATAKKNHVLYCLTKIFLIQKGARKDVLYRIEFV